jgi:predicted RNase H-like HicB family nuclease/predicted RNA binding protein YcfA (HicA-like mRNA interferase family)
MHSYRVACWKQDHWYIAQCQEIDVATQGGSEAEAEANMQEALSLHLDVPEDHVTVIMERQTATPPKGSKAERSFRAVRFRLEAEGFRGITQKPNHAKFIKTTGDTTITAILPHYTELSQAVLSSILRQANLPPDTFE